MTEKTCKSWPEFVGRKVVEQERQPATWRDIARASGIVQAHGHSELAKRLARLAEVMGQAAEREPLTSERVQGLVGDAAVLIGREWETDFASAATKLVRMTEAAHNIKGEA